MAISDNTSSSSSQQEVSKLQNMMKNGADEASGYLDSLKSKFTDYDNSHKSSKETATSYFQTAMDQARASVDQLKKSSEDIRAEGNNASDAAVDKAKRAMDQAGSSLDDLGKSAQEYDRRARDSINSSVDSAKDNGSSTLSSWQDSIASLVDSTRESTFRGFEKLQDQFTITQTAMREHASNTADGISNKAAEVSEKAKPADSNPTLMERAKGAVSSSVDYVTSAFQGPDGSSSK